MMAGRETPMTANTARQKTGKNDWARIGTQALREIEQTGFQWAVRCFDSFLTRDDLEYFALTYKPFYEATGEMREAEGWVVRFDPFSQHRHCRLLFEIAFSRHGARMVSPPEYPPGEIPDPRFAAFERGVILSLRNLYQLESDGKISSK